VLDERLRLSPSCELVCTASDVPLIVFTGEDADESKIASMREYGVDVINSGTRDLTSILKGLGRLRSIQSVFIEGGPTLAASFVEAGLIDKVSFFVAPKIIGGVDAPSAIGGSGVDVIRQALTLRDVRIQRHGEDIEITGYPTVNREDG
jgi:diaminohydroxyphosphoribosylaminopyrimidine deaminase/5-amino-6-(5-phosphoribosylamino)uracil reductase